MALITKVNKTKNTALALMMALHPLMINAPAAKNTHMLRERLGQTLWRWSSVYPFTDSPNCFYLSFPLKSQIHLLLLLSAGMNVVHPSLTQPSECWRTGICS